jgi:hypothetical protein
MNAKEYEARLKDPRFYRQTMARIRSHVREIDKMTKNCQLGAAVVFLDCLEERLKDLREIIDQKDSTT